jgi:hypothetical protein
MRLLGFVFLSLIIASSVVAIDYYLPGTFLHRFFDSSFIETFGGLVGFNIAAVIFISGQLYIIEERVGKSNVFTSTKQEIKHNAYFLLGSFVFSILLLLLRPDLQTDTALLVNKLYYTLTTVVLAVFSLAIFAVYEILRAVFTIGDMSSQSK